jgi:hypothetical protein
VPAAVGDAFCGPAARIGADGCAFRSCPGDEAVDVASGSCLARSTLGHHEGAPCTKGTAPLVESGRVACVDPEATCPRGTRRDGTTCARGSLCPPGSLAEGKACRPIVMSGAPGTPARIDVGAWAALALGVDGGSGQAALCSPLAQRPTAFGLESGGVLTLNIHVALAVPDEDMSRVHATVVAADADGHHLLTAVGQNLVVRAVDAQVEALRSLGGVASTAAVEVRVRCGLALPQP